MTQDKKRKLPLAANPSKELIQLYWENNSANTKKKKKSCVRNSCSIEESQTVAKSLVRIHRTRNFIKKCSFRKESYCAFVQQDQSVSWRRKESYK